ncbi:hypothetical protein ACFE04_017850 [Oxalis oulophora]
MLRFGTILILFVVINSVKVKLVNGLHSIQKIDQGSVKCNTCNPTPILYPPPPPVPCPPPPAPALPPPSPPKKPPSGLYCPPPPAASLIYIPGPPGNLYPIDMSDYNAATQIRKSSVLFTGGLLLVVLILMSFW